MFIKPSTRIFALVGASLISAIAASAQQGDQALLDLLIKKGLVTAGEAAQLKAEAAKSALPPGLDVISNPTDKYIKKITLSGRFQTQFVDLGTHVDNAASQPAATQHFLLRRIYLGTKVDFTQNLSGVVNYDFANVSFDAAYVDWKASDLFSLDAGLRKAPFDYEEVTSSGTLKAIERSTITRYFDEPNNGRRLGAASYRTGLYASGVDGGFFYSLAVTNPERNEYSGDGTSGPAVNGNAGLSGASNATNNNFAYYGWAGYGDKWSGGTYKFGAEAGYLPDQGGPGAAVGQGNNLKLYGFFGDVTSGAFNLQAEWMGANDRNGAVIGGVAQDANPKGYWIQPSLYVLPKMLEAVVRYSYVDSDRRGVTLADGIRSAPSGGTMNKLDEWYLGGNWYLDGNDVKLQFGYIHGEGRDTVSGGAAKASTDGLRTQVQVNF